MPWSSFHLVWAEAASFLSFLPGQLMNTSCALLNQHLNQQAQNQGSSECAFQFSKSIRYARILYCSPCIWYQETLRNNWVRLRVHDLSRWVQVSHNQYCRYQVLRLCLWRRILKRHESWGELSVVGVHAHNI